LFEHQDVTGSQPSYSNGPCAVSLIGCTVGDAFDAAVSRAGSRDALIVRHQGIKWSYSELGQHVDAFAAGLLALGLRKGDRAGIWSPNNAEWIIAQYATAKVGVILVNINPGYRIVELSYALNKVGCKALIFAEKYKGSNYLEMVQGFVTAGSESSADHEARASSPEVLINIGVDSRPGCVRFADVLESGRRNLELLSHPGERPQFDEPINIQFTSGTTGAPKGATLSHHNIVNNAFFTCDAMRFTEQDRLCLPVPLYHCFGMVMGSLGCVMHHACLVLPAEGFDPEATLAAVSQERCTALYGVPTMFVGMLNHPDFTRYDLSSLRTGIMAGAPCPVEVMRRAVTSMGMREVTIAYGMTETSPVSCQTSTADDVEHRVSTVGKAHPHIEIKIIDPQGAIVPRGTPGELCTRGYSVMLGYWDDPARTREAIDEARWMHTGDLAVMREDGYCNIVGRLKDMVIRGGENIYPREVEEFLYRHPSIEEVQVFGIPDPKYGEELCAWIKIRSGRTLTPEEVVSFCCGQIAHYKVPRHMRFVEHFPMTVTGKIQKFVMREQMITELGIRSEVVA
jgi:fatty-acyl-CoA synthase